MKKNTGFTLIEVLIAMVVLAVGLLGLAGLQATSLKNNQSAYNRSQATQLAYDIADKMRANTNASANYLTSYMPPTAADPKSNCLSAAGCSPTNMAENDLYEWNTAISQVLPEGAIGTIELNSGIYTVTINWDDNRDGDIDGNGGAPEGDTDGDGDTDDDPNFLMSFQL